MAITSIAFEKLYKELNPAQRQAVETIEGPVMVIAGPGTGKTQILTLRIAYILLKTDIPPDAILALTFTESGVQAMRKRLVEIIGPAAYRVAIYTFHSFANDVIRRFPDSFPRIIGSRHSPEAEQIRILEDVVGKGKFERIKSFGDPFFYVKSILEAIRTLKRENISPKTLKAVIEKKEAEFREIPDIYYREGKFAGKMKGKYREAKKSLERNKELMRVYRAYEKRLSDHRLFDYEDMIMEVVRILERDEDLRLRLEEEYLYILADEHQDANNAQNRLLELLGSFHDNPNIFVVGDEKQAIFRFQGASLENFLSFKRRFPSASIFYLTENYRSPQWLLDGAHSLIEKSRERASELRPRLKSREVGIKGKIKICQFSTEAAEESFIVESVNKELAREAGADSIAVLYRDNNDARPISAAFERGGLPYRIESNQNLFDHPGVAKIITLLRAVDSFGDEALTIKALHADFLGIDPFDVYKAASTARSLKRHLYDVLGSPKLLRKAGLKKEGLLPLFISKLRRWKTIAHNEHLAVALEMILEESGFMSELLRKGVPEHLRVFESFLDEAKVISAGRAGATLSYLLSSIDTALTYGLPIHVKSAHIDERAARLMTAHKAKGQEFDVVYIIRAVDRHWGNRRESNHFDLPIYPLTTSTESSNDDERRLFYVALTRARRAVTITYAREDREGNVKLPCQFLSEISPELLEVRVAEAFEARLKTTLSTGERRSIERVKISDRDFIASRFLEQGFSVTALNNYLTCPWLYFFRNLIRVPEIESRTALYGTVVHEALSQFFEGLRAGKKPLKRDLISLFQTYLSKKPLSEKDIEEALKRGERALGGYFDTYRHEWKGEALTDYNIAGVFIDLPFEGAPRLLLKGTLDKIDFLSGSGDVRVSDWKTSKPKSRNEIEGKTKRSTGDFKRQLVFYRLLLERHPQEKFRMREGTVDFIEPDEHGRHRREIFEIGEEEVDELTSLIKRVGKEIYTIEFWDRRCDDNACEYCKLRGVMKI